MPSVASSSCCSVKTMCGRTLWYGVACVSVATLTLAVIMLVLSILNVIMITSSETQLNSRPLVAMDLLLALMIIFLSTYQIIITGLMLWQSLKTKGKIFLCSVWYVSHLSILFLYACMFCARVAVCITQKRYFTTVITIFTGFLYEGIFIYFTVVVNSYIHSFNHDRYF